MSNFDFSDQAKQTDEQYAAEIARLTKLTSADIQDLFPNKVDKDRLTDLMKIVKAATSRNEKVAELGKNFGMLGESAIRLLEALT